MSLSWLLGLLLAASSPLAASDLTDALTRQREPAARLVANPGDLQEISRLTGFPAPVLEDYVVVEFSSWELSGRPFTHPAGLQILEMLDSPAALGLFSLARDQLPRPSQSLTWGLEAAASTRQLIFWEGNAFFRVTTQEDLDLEALRPWAMELRQYVQEPSTYPTTVVQLPQTGLDPDSVRFYLCDEALATQSEFPKALLGSVGFEDQAEVAAARYQPEGKTLFLIGYPTGAVTEQHFSAIQNRLQSVFSPQGIYLKRSGLLIAIVEAPEATAMALLDRVRYRANVRWLYEKDTSQEDRKRRRGEILTFFGIITTALIFSGVFILIVVVLGVLLGVCRYQLLEHFPQMRHKDDMVRLDLRPLPNPSQPPPGENSSGG